MRPDQGSIFAGTIMAENAQARLRHILESEVFKHPEESSPDSDNFKKLMMAYDACMDEYTVKQRGTTPLEDVLARLEETYSIGSAFAEDPKDNLTNAISYLAGIGVRALVGFDIGPDDRNPDSVVIFLTPLNAIGLPAREYYNNSEIVTDYTEVAKKVLQDFSDTKFHHLIKDVVSFEGKLANVTPNTETQEDVTKYYNPLTIKETQKLVPQISFADIISSLAPSGYEDDRVIVGSPSYMKSLSNILSETSRETIQLFFKWKAIQRYAYAIEDPKVEPIQKFLNRLAGKDPQASEERWRKCIKSLDRGLGWSLSRFYILDSFSEDSKKLGDQIVSDIKERFIFTLDQTFWMSPEVRKLAKEKVANIVQKIGYPTKSPNVGDPEDVKQYYEDLKISNETFFENELASTRFNIHREWSKLGKPTDRDEWEMTTPTVNAYYKGPGNEIAFLAGIMQPPVFYGRRAPLYMSYGPFGSVSGHELSHAFDSTGRHYDQTGNYTNWWDDKTVEAFKERAQCFVDQYSNFTVNGTKPEPLHVSGRLTLGENIADAGGISAAFHAWKKHDEASPDPHLPGLTSFSKEQLFFIAYGNWWCSKTTREAAEEAIYNDPHAPKPARNNGTMENSREFKEAFKCPIVEPVCKLW
ncbi:hypothetical protein MAP00_002495 [Monascus purpureus]|nr:hypothetical protein MAP00_002495 [Monascus purpureus]